MRPEAVKDFLTRASGSEIIDALTALANSDNLQALDGLRAFLLVRDDHTYMKHAVPRLASLAALQHGEAGVRLLVEALPMAPGMIYPTAILESLWHASKGQVPPTHFFDVLPPPPALTKPLPGDTIAAAAKGVRDVLADAALNEDLFQVVINFLWGTGFLAPDSFVDRKALLGLLAEGSIRLSPALIREYHDLIASDVREEEYQRFLMSHPVFIDPLAAEVIGKQRLGAELVTDFVVRRHDFRYVLVEIEKPQDRIFIAGNDFSASFTHAMGQVLDFQQWVDSHGEYARSLMPSISSPRGLVIIGRRSELTDPQRLRLHRYNCNSATIDVVTFDDLAVQAALVYKSVHHLGGAGSA